MSDDLRPVDFDLVREQELDEIAKRRREANISCEKDESGRKTPLGEDLVGLALSGGGVRSASFNLGFIQSLYERGLLRHIDFMSTVSGGGYVGSSLSSLALHPDTEFYWQTKSTDEDSPDTDSKHLTGEFPLSPNNDGRQSPRVLELIHGGHYLRRPLIFLNRYLVGVLLTNVVALSAVFAVAAFAAWLFRCLDHTWMINWLFALGFQGDIGRAFFPAVLFFILWLVMWGISYWRRGSQAEGKVAQLFLTLTIVSFLLAGAALLGTGDVSLTHLRDNYGIEPPSELVRSIGGELKTYILFGLLIALLPYLRIKDLIRSGTRPRSAAESWVFGIASRALLYGIPLLIFGWMARENISHFNENRTTLRHGHTFNSQSDFIPLDFRDWSGTWQEIELRAADVPDQQSSGIFPVSRRIWDAVSHQEIARSREILQEITAYNHDANLLKRWLLYLGYAVTRQTNEVTDQFQRRQDYLDLRWSVCRQLTDGVLTDPAFYTAFGDADESLSRDLVTATADERRVREAEIEALVSEARHLEKRIADVASGGKTFQQWLSERSAILEQLDRNAAAGITEDTVSLRQDLTSLMTLADGGYEQLEIELKALNWELVEKYFGGRVSPKSTVYAMVVLDGDQSTRWAWFIWASVLFVASACVVNMNATSLHGFYRNMLSKMWVTGCPGIGRNIPLARLETVARGAPYHLISATVHLLGRRRETDRATTDVFTFSQLFCGSSRTGYVSTESYMNGQFDLSNAMALSGAAVSPTQVQNPLLAVLLMLSNSRLGQWLPNPGYRLLVSSPLNRWLRWLAPVPLRLLIGACQQAEQRKYCFVSDGGHHENLGLESLLLRRCRLIIATDVTGDPRYEFADFTKLLRRMRFEFGIRIVGLDGSRSVVPLDSVTPKQLQAEFLQGPDTPAVNPLSGSNRTDAHYFVARILYPDGGPLASPQEGYLVYVKPTFTGDEAIDLLRYQIEDPAFPNDPTADQFYDPQKFESYRQLGFHIGNIVCSEQFQDCNGSTTLSRWQPSPECCETASFDDPVESPFDSSRASAVGRKQSRKNKNQKQGRRGD